jgi:SagB-type dehydrogenase family enzyme
MNQADTILLPAPARESHISVEASMARRRSVRSFAGSALSLDEMGQVLWACQGVTEPMPQAPEGFSWEWMGGLRTVPSAGALYPLEVYAVIGAVEGVEPGVYHYLPVEHALALYLSENLREPLWNASLRQTAILEAPVTLVIAGVVNRTAAKYGDRAERYVHMEVGAAGENVYLQAEALDLGTVFMGAFDDDAVAGVLGLPDDQRVFAIMPVGRVDPSQGPG